MSINGRRMRLCKSDIEENASLNPISKVTRLEAWRPICMSRSGAHLAPSMDTFINDYWPLSRSQVPINLIGFKRETRSERLMRSGSIGLSMRFLHFVVCTSTCSLNRWYIFADSNCCRDCGYIVQTLISLQYMRCKLCLTLLFLPSRSQVLASVKRPSHRGPRDVLHRSVLSVECAGRWGCRDLSVPYNICQTAQQV